MATIKLEEAKVKRLLTYLEYLADTKKNLETIVIKEDVMALMKDISSQTGVTLTDDELATPIKADTSDHVHIPTARGSCALCGEVIKHEEAKS